MIHTVTGFGSKVDQISPKWDTFGTFSDSKPKYHEIGPEKVTDLSNLGPKSEITDTDPYCRTS